MHSSRMRTVRCSGRLWGVGEGVCLGVSAQGGVCPGECLLTYYLLLIPK